MRGASYLAGVDLKKDRGKVSLFSMLVGVLRRMWVCYYQVASLDKQQRLLKLPRTVPKTIHDLLIFSPVAGCWNIQACYASSAFGGIT